MSWVYIRSEPRLWTVGFYDPWGKWHPDSDHGSSEEAAERVHYLNGAPYPDVSGGGVPYDEDETRYVDNPTPHSDDCDCEACVTFYAERNKS